MRKNTAAAIRSLRNMGANRSARSIWTDGETLFSYGTAILTRVGPYAVLNETQYSQTTSEKQNSIERELGGIQTVKVDGLPRGVDRRDLISAALERNDLSDEARTHLEMGLDNSPRPR